MNKQQLKILLKNILGILSPNLLHFIKMKRFKNILPHEFLSHIDILNSNSLVIDVGANVGLVSELMAKTGAEVIAFEPNKEALVKLKTVAKEFPKIRVNPVAAGIKNDQVKLFLHKDSIDSKEDLTQSSSLKGAKPNVSTDLAQSVSEIDFAEFIKKIDRKIDLIKIDIEGYEIELINHLLDQDALVNVEKIYLETHERKFTALIDSTRKMKFRIEEEGLSQKFFFDWH